MPPVPIVSEIKINPNKDPVSIEGVCSRDSTCVWDTDRDGNGDTCYKPKEKVIGYHYIKEKYQNGCAHLLANGSFAQNMMMKSKEEIKTGAAWKAKVLIVVLALISMKHGRKKTTGSVNFCLFFFISIIFLNLIFFF